MSSCALKKAGTFTDDVYANPSAERKEDARLAAIQKAKEDAYKQRYNDSLQQARLAQKALDDANPNYKDREFKYDDYYDYEYATRVKRFDNSINGLSYYDNYYTNSYWYNHNPYNYGVSVYNGYSWWGNSYNNYSYNPSANFYYNNGWGCNNGYGYNGYNPYMSGYASGYNNGYNNGYYGMPYGYGNSFGFGFGYNSGYGNPYGYNGYNGWNNYYGNNGWSIIFYFACLISSVIISYRIRIIVNIVRLWSRNRCKFFCFFLLFNHSIRVPIIIGIVR